MLASVSDQHPSRHLVLRFSENEKVREAERQQAQTGKQLWMRVRRGRFFSVAISVKSKCNMEAS